jgi:hypothetical protein
VPPSSLIVANTEDVAVTISQWQHSSTVGQPTTWIWNAITTTEIDLCFKKDIKPVSYVDHRRPQDCNAKLPFLSVLNQHHYVRQDTKRR